MTDTMMKKTRVPEVNTLDQMLAAKLPASWWSEELSGFGDVFRDDADPDWLTPSED